MGISKLTRLTLGISAGFAIVATALTACGSGKGSYNDNRGWGDAGIAGRDDSKTWIVNNADGYPNVSIKCDGKYGYMLFTVTHGTSDVPPLVVPDPRCPGYRADLQKPANAPNAGNQPPKDDN